MKFNEDSRVKIPSILHLIRLGYEYLSLKDATYDTDTNIFTDIFKKSIHKINSDLEYGDVKRFYLVHDEKRSRPINISVIEDFNRECEEKYCTDADRDTELK